MDNGSNRSWITKVLERFTKKYNNNSKTTTSRSTNFCLQNCKFRFFTICIFKNFRLLEITKLGTFYLKITNLSSNCHNLIFLDCFGVIWRLFSNVKHAIDHQKAYWLKNLFAVECFYLPTMETSRKFETLHKKSWIWNFFISHSSGSFLKSFGSKILQLSSK